MTKTFVATILIITLVLSSCGSTGEVSDQSSSIAPAISAPNLPNPTPAIGSSKSAGVEDTTDTVHYATAKHLDELGYVFSVPPDIGVKDTNNSFSHLDKASTLGNIYPYSDSYQIAYFDENSGELEKWMAGKYTALHPCCYYGIDLIDGESNQYAFALLQTFSNEDLAPINTALRFKDKDGYIYTQTIEQVKPYIIYQDTKITVYNFLEFVQFPSLEMQMQERWETMRYNQYGLSYEWILEVKDYFMEQPGGIGRFITKLPQESGFSEISSALQVSFSEASLITHFNKSNIKLNASQINIAELLQLLYTQQYSYLGTWKSLDTSKEPIFFTLREGYSKLGLYKDGTVEFANEKDGNAVYYKTTPCSNLYQWLEARCS